MKRKRQTFEDWKSSQIQAQVRLLLSCDWISRNNLCRRYSHLLEHLAPDQVLYGKLTGVLARFAPEVIALLDADTRGGCVQRDIKWWLQRGGA